MLDFNTEPYNDDFDENNKFYRILFRPSYAVQARELTQLQSILQQQIKYHGSHVFKQGAMVIPGQISLDTNYNYVKLQATYAGNVVETYISNLAGATLVGTSGVTAQVLHIENAVSSDPTTIYVRYTTSGTNNTTKTFSAGEVLTTSDGNYSVQAAASSATGVGSAAVIERGVYYINGFFVLCDAQTVVLDKYTNTPSYRIGLKVVESKTTPELNETLLDNAQNSYNYAAPGAHRYFIDLTLTALAIDSTSDESFIELLQCSNGQIKREVTKTAYAEIEKTLARRTYDESGNYTTTPFKIDVREHRNNNRGAWSSARAYLVGDVVTNNGNTYVAKKSATSVNNGQPIPGPIHTSGLAYDGNSSTGVQWEYNETPYYNRGIYDPLDAVEAGDQTKLAIGLEPGKAYVQGYEIEKISTTYLTVNKPRTYLQTSNSYLSTPMGNFVYVTNINALPPFDSSTGFPTVTIYNKLTSTVGVAAGGTAIGTARVRGIEWDNGNIGTQTSIYKLYLFDIKINSGYDFTRDAKSFYYRRDTAGVADPELSFTADINAQTTVLSGSVTTYTSYPGTRGSSTTLYGVGTSFQGGTTSPYSPALKVGDYIYVGTNKCRVASIVSNQQITIDSPAITVDGEIVKLITTSVVEPQNSKLVYQLPNYAIKSVTNSSNTEQIIYYTMKYIDGVSATSGGSLTINTGGGVFADPAETDNFILVCADPTTGGPVVNPVSYGAGGSSSLTFTVSSTYYSKAFAVMATIKKTAGRKSKTLLSNDAAPQTFTTAATATKTILQLNKADIFRIKSVMMDTGSFTSPSSSYTIDITDRYDFDNGQRDTHYDVGRLILKTTYSPPTAPIKVFFEYFDHSSGDYFSVDSYPFPTDMRYEDIPSYNGVSLRDCIDFRPRINDAGTVFSGSGASFALTPKRGQDVTVDYSYYLGRKDKITIDTQGNFSDITGVPALVPTQPGDPALGMTLYNITLEPYTFGTTNSNIVIDQVDNKRYTMRDIGKLEKRIDNLEYYTSLSLLEQETSSLSVTDSTGLDRFKNGFIVDGFKGHNVGNVLSPDYKCSIDMNNGELRPFYTMTNVNLIENIVSSTSADTDRNTAGYKLYGDVITLPLNSTTPHVELVKQQYASRLENINPFAIFTFLGDIKLNPSSDDWFETKYDSKYDIIRNVEGSFNTVAALATQAGILGTIWGAWQINWYGEPVIQNGGSLIQYTTGSNWANERALSEGATYINVNEFNNRFGTAGGGGPARQVYVEARAQKGIGHREGVKSTLAVQWERQVIDDRIISTAVIPYMRSRNILVQVKKLKANTKFYAYFDNIDVSTQCTPSSLITYTLPTSTSVDFDITSNAGGGASDTGRVINTITGKLNSDNVGNMCLNVGDMITGGTSSATAVVIGKDYNPDTGIRRLHVMNIKGTFQNGETITGSISGALGTISAVPETNKSLGGDLVTNFRGDLNFIFNLPNNDALKFRTGTREFKLLDVSSASGQWTSSAKTQFEASGVLQTRAQTINNIRNGHIIQEIVKENDTVTRTIERVARDTGWYDPLAQTFLVQSKGGAFLSKVDIYFASKDSKYPVTLQIREVVNGYPGKRILPFSEVTLNPEQVNLSVNTVTLTDGSEANYPKYDTPTTFTFPSPIYVEDNTEYCIVLASDCSNYKVWISQMGDQIPDSSRTISEQPYAGVLFKSQNASTWTANQDQDLKFTIWRANFETNSVGNVTFVNDVLTPELIESDPFETVSGQNKLRVWHANHGMFPGSYVQFTNTDDEVINGTALTGTLTVTAGSTAVTGGTSGAAQTYFTYEILSSRYVLRRASDNAFVGVISGVTDDNHLVLLAGAAVPLTGVACKICKPIAGSNTGGIPTTEIYKNSGGTQITHTISDVDLDSYCITVSSTAGRTGYSGGNTVNATHNVMYDMIQPAIQIQNFSETQCDVAFANARGKSVDGTETPYTMSSPPTYYGVTPNDTNILYSPAVIASSVNQSFVGSKSAFLKASISSDNPALSPIIDTHRTSLVAISNKVNSPTPDNINVDVIDTRTVFTGADGAFSFANAGSAWAASTSVSLNAQLYYLGNLYTVTQAGTTGTVAPIHTTGYAANGTAILTYAGYSTTITTSNATIAALMPTISVGKYITITSATTAGNNNSTTGYLVTAVAGDGSTTGTITVARGSNWSTAEAAASGTTIKLKNLYVSEIAPKGSSSVNKYISKNIKLADPSTFFRIRLAANCPTEANILVYYKTSPVGSTVDFDTVNWTQSYPDADMKKVQKGDFTTFYDVDYSEEKLTPFDTIAVKIVLQSTNSSAIPKVKDLRIIACA